MKALLEWAGHVVMGFMLTVWMLMGISLTDPRTGLYAVLAGTAYRPYIYRVLATWAIQALVGLTGVPALAALIAIQLVALTIFSKAVWELAGMVRWRRAAWLVVMLGLISLSSYTVHIYDAPTMATWTVALLALYRRQWRLMIVAYGLACLSKETAILFVPIVALVDRDWRRVGLLAVIYAAVHLPILWYFHGNAGAAMELHMDGHLPLFPVYILVALDVGALLGWRWKYQPPEFRAALAVGPLFVWLYLIGGFPGELRVFEEIWPIIGLTLFNTFVLWRTHDQETREPIHSVYPYWQADPRPAPDAKERA